MSLSSEGRTPLVGTQLVGIAQVATTDVASATNYGQGYVMFGADGGAFAFGNAGFYGTISTIPGGGGTPQTWLGDNIVSGAESPAKDGYWYLGGAGTWPGSVCVRGSAEAENNNGTADNVTNFCAHAPSTITYVGTPVAIAAKDDGGYWVTTTTGNVYAFGDAGYYNGVTSTPTPIVAMAPTSDGLGYWLVNSGGNVYAFGDAAYQGGVTGTLNKPIVGIDGDPAVSTSGHTGNNGYWLVASDGGIFNYNAPFLGSMGATTLAQPITSIVASGSGQGYLMAAADGGVFTFGDFAYQGAMSGSGLSSTNSPPNNIVAVGGS